MAKSNKTKNIIVFSDTHCGCKMGLYPPKMSKLDEGSEYKQSTLQKKLWAIWKEFWGKWVPKVTHGEPYDIVFGGDAMDGAGHHGSKHQISTKWIDQIRIAKACLEPVVEKAERYYHIRGTEAHVGASGEYEEILAEGLGAIPNEEGQYARFELWKRCGPALAHFMHHIGTTGSSAYESTAVYKEMVEQFVEAGRWGDEPPQVVVRAHRHRQFETRVPTQHGYGISMVTPAWQLKTPFTYKIPGGRVAQPQIGGSLIRMGDEELHTRHFVKRIERPKEEE